MNKLFLLVLLLVSVPGFASEATDIMAEVLIELEHYPTDVDKSFLDEVIADSDATADEKALAAIIRRIEHQPLAEDVSTLVRLSRSDVAEIRTIADATLSIEHQVSDEHKAALEGLSN